MKRYVLDTSINLSNRAWKLAGKTAAKPPELSLTLPDSRMTEMCADVFEQLAERVAFPFGNRFRSSWLQSSRDLSMSSSTETAFGAMLLRHWDPEAAFDILRVFFNNRSIEGRMPLSLTPFTVSGFPAYPFVLHALCKWFDTTGDSPRTRDLFRKYLKYSDWLVIYHKGEGGFYSHRDEHWFKYDFLVRPLVVADGSVAARWKDVLSVGLNSVMAYQYRLMSRAAYASGEQRDGRKLDNHAKKLSVMLHEKFWNEEAGFYFDAIGEHQARRPVISGLLPLIAEAPSRSQAARMAEKAPALTADIMQHVSTRYKDSVLLYLVSDGLGKYGMHKEASRLAFEQAAHAASIEGVPENLFQRIVAVNTLMDHVLGYFNYGTRLVLFPRLPVEWTGRSCFIDDSAKGLKIEFTLLENSKVEYKISRDRAEPISLTIENNHFKNIDLADPAGAVAPAPPSTPSPAEKPE